MHLQVGYLVWEYALGVIYCTWCFIPAPFICCTSCQNRSGHEGRRGVGSCRPTFNGATICDCFYFRDRVPPRLNMCRVVVGVLLVVVVVVWKWVSIWIGTLVLETKKDESLKNRPKKIEQAKERWPGLAWLRERLAVGFGASSEIIMAPSFMACFLCCCCFVPCVSFRSLLSTTNHNLNVRVAVKRLLACVSNENGLAFIVSVRLGPLFSDLWA